MDEMISSALMQETSEGLIHDFPDLVTEFESLSITPQSFEDIGESRGKSFRIIDSKEKFLVSDLESFRKKIGLSSVDTKGLKVISIFGNSGDGKSHTMNHVFFDGEEVFKTGNEQSSCTLGVNCYYQKFFYNHEILCVDSEGLQCATLNENQQMRMLMKVLAISDIIIYRTRAERLSIDMYKFLATASKTYVKHFSPMLNADNSTAKGGPHVIIFHETQNTQPLTNNNLNDEEPERVIREKFAEMSLSIEAFSSLKYVGIKTSHPPTDFHPLKSILRKKIEAIDEEKTRPIRTFRSIYEALLALNTKFSGDIKETDYTLHELHFTCEMVCEACNQRCENTKDHKKDGIEHKNDSACSYQQQLNNKIYLCKKCHMNGNGRKVVRINDVNGDSSWMGLAKNYAWSFGGTQIQKLDCTRCGEIYRAKWYGNKSPEEICVLAEAVHIWRDGSTKNQAATHSAQAILDGFSYISETISNVSAQPTKSISSWVADNLVNPSYWRANSEIICCKSCRIHFQRNGLKIHHCRNCGEGFCSNCSRSRMSVPKRGWQELVRVCNPCRDELVKNENGNSECQENPDDEAKAVRVRKYGEFVANAASSLVSALEIPKEMIKDSVRPDYWEKDSESHFCAICKILFGNQDDMNQSELLYRETSSGSGNSSQDSPVHNVIDKRRHHCRGCGKAVCDKCSLNRKQVPEHGWNTNVRVCDNCWTSKDRDV